MGAGGFVGGWGAVPGAVVATTTVRTQDDSAGTNAHQSCAFCDVADRHSAADPVTTDEEQDVGVTRGRELGRKNRRSGGDEDVVEARLELPEHPAEGFARQELLSLEDAGAGPEQGDAVVVDEQTYRV